MNKRKHPVAISLLRNSQSAMTAAIEIHNKPVFPYRYEVCIILIINAWELLLKAYLYKYKKNVKIFRKDGTTKPFEECLSCVASNMGKDFQVVKESLDRLYDYRNSVVHLYMDGLDVILYSLLKANIVFYSAFIKDNFRLDLSKENNLILLPIAFSRPYSPIDFLFNKSSLTKAPEELRRFINGIIESSQRLISSNIEDSILADFRMNVTKESRLKNADIIAGINNTKQTGISIVIQDSLKDVRITEDMNSKTIKVVEDELFDTVFTESYNDIVELAKKSFVNFKRGKIFNEIMADVKKDQTLCRYRYLDPKKPNTSKRAYYSKHVYDVLAEHFENERTINNLYSLN